MLSSFSLAKCNKHMKHKCGVMSVTVAAALHSVGKLANISLKDTISFSPCRMKSCSKILLENVAQLQRTKDKIDCQCIKNMKQKYGIKVE